MKTLTYRIEDASAFSHFITWNPENEPEAIRLEVHPEAALKGVTAGRADGRVDASAERGGAAELEDAASGVAEGGLQDFSLIGQTANAVTV